ncbi:MAG: hypothetical protein LBP33_08070 [Candidatus Adiutrix sp.]|jgi:hypothetical protein|nr:hypothetical protein [Candidatus Adiutrix sp.]
MNISSLTNERVLWGATGNSGQAALLGSVGGSSFEETLKQSVGFGSKSESGGLVESPAAGHSTMGDLISQLQFSFLKNDGSGGLSNRLSNALF